VGMHLVELDESRFTVRFAREGVMLDLGSIGKGYAIERGAQLVREAGVASALLQGGTSTVCAIGTPPNAEAWKIAIERPATENGSWEKSAMADNVGNESSRKPDPLLAVVPLRDGALSVSAVWGKSFTAEGKSYGHVLDPRTGQPVEGALLAAVALESATETDALSTALLTAGQGQFKAVNALRPGMRSLLLAQEGDGYFAEARGISVMSERGPFRERPSAAQLRILKHG
jgi:thiamine biosynthesis lipoprotein